MFALFLAFVANTFAQQIWKKELEEEVKIIEFLDSDTKLFIAAQDYIYLFDTETGKSVYEIELEDYLDKALYNLVGTTFLVAPNDETILAIDALTGKEKWKKQYEDLDQDDFTQLHNIGGNPVIQYGSLHIATDLATGKFLWGNNYSYDGEISLLGGWNYKEFESKGSFMIITPDETAILVDAKTGNTYGSFGNFEPEEDMVKSTVPWTFTDKKENYILFTLDDELLAIDVKTGKTAIRTEMDWDKGISPFIQVENGVIVLGEDKIIYLNTENGRNSTINVKVEDFRTYSIFYEGDNSYLFAGFKNQLMAIDLTSGSVLWKSKEDDDNFKGYAHRYLEMKDNKLLMSYVYGENPPNGGTWIRALSVDVKTGKVNYNTKPLILSETYINSFVRMVSSFAPDPFGFSKWNNLGFWYTSTVVDNKLILSVSHRGTMLNPTTREDGGDGIAVVDTKTGAILLEDYNELNDYGSADGKSVDRIESKWIGDKYLVSGNIRSALYDMKTMKKVWLSDKYEERYIVDAEMLGDDIYYKYGFLDFTVKLTPPGLIGWFGASIDVKENDEEDPHGVMSLDSKTGKLKWDTELDKDPAFATPNFSLAKYYSIKNKTLLYSDEENIYALGSNGKYNWKKNYDDLGIGSIPYDKIYAVHEEFLSHDYTTTSTYTSGGYRWKVTRTETSKDYEGISKFVEQMGTSDASLVYKSGANYWGATAKKTLGLFVGGEDVLVLGSKGVARLDRLSGDVKWKTDWDYDADEVELTPTFVGDKIVYCFSEKLEVVDYATGKKEWSAEEDSDAKFIISPTGKFIFTLDKEDIIGYGIK